MKNICSIILFLLSIQGIWGQQSLQTYLQTAAKNNPGLKAKYYEYQAALQQLPQAGSLPDPQLNFGIAALPIITKNGPQQAKISLSQKMPWFGTLRSKQNVFDNRAKAQYESFQEAKAKLFYEIKSLYFDLYYLKKSLDITQKNLEILENWKQLIMTKIQNGKASATDGLRIDMQIEEVNNTLASLQDKLEVSSIKFNHLLNVETDTKVQIANVLPKKVLLQSKSEMYERIQQENHRLKRLDWLKKSQVNQEKLNKKLGKPNLLLGVDYGFISKTNNLPDAGKDALLFKVGVSIPLFRKKYKAMVQESQYQQKAFEEKRNDHILVLKSWALEVYSKYEDAIRREKLYKNQAVLARRAKTLLENEYAYNGKDFEEILRMEKKRLQYELKREKAITDKQKSIALLQYLTGM